MGGGHFLSQDCSLFWKSLPIRGRAAPGVHHPFNTPQNVAFVSLAYLEALVLPLEFFTESSSYLLPNGFHRCARKPGILTHNYLTVISLRIAVRAL